LGEGVKARLLDKRMEFQKDEAGRVILNDYQWMDMAITTAKSQEQFKDLFTQRSKLDEDIKSLEKKVDDLILGERQEDQKVNSVSLDLARINAEREALEQEFEEFRGEQIMQNKAIDQLKKDIGIAEGVLTRMGDINMKAIDAYDRVLEEYDAFNKKKEKLSTEREDVLLMINEIETKKKEIFMKTFDAVNTHFKITFSKLTTKGDAFLELESPETPFEEGVNIKVRITGTKFLWKSAFWTNLTHPYFLASSEFFSSVF